VIDRSIPRSPSGFDWFTHLRAINGLISSYRISTLLTYGGTKVIGHKIFSGEGSIWLVSIAASAQALSILGSPSAQLAHPLALAAQVLFSHLFLPLLQANHASWSHRRVMSFPSSLDDDAQGAQFMDLGPQIGPILQK
jgi:hypothetical protein